MSLYYFLPECGHVLYVQHWGPHLWDQRRYLHNCFPIQKHNLSLSTGLEQKYLLKTFEI